MPSPSPMAAAVAAGKLRRARHLFGAGGRAVFVAMDHPAYMGAGVSAAAAGAIAGARPDGILATWHLAPVPPRGLRRIRV